MGVGFERMTVPAAEKVWRSTRTVVAVGSPNRVARGSSVQMAIRSTATTPTTDGAGSGQRRARTRDTHHVTGDDAGGDGEKDMGRRPAPGSAGPPPGRRPGPPSAGPGRAAGRRPSPDAGGADGGADGSRQDRGAWPAGRGHRTTSTEARRCRISGRALAAPASVVTRTMSSSPTPAAAHTALPEVRPVQRRAEEVGGLVGPEQGQGPHQGLPAGQAGGDLEAFTGAGAQLEGHAVGQGPGAEGGHPADGGFERGGAVGRRPQVDEQGQTARSRGR